MIPEDLRYTAEHEWVAGDGTGPVRVGITHYAQDALGDIVYVQLPEPGTVVQAGQSLGEVESTKSVSEIYAPLDGVIVEVNGELADNPQRLNEDPYAEGWMFVIEPADEAQLGELLDAEGYRALIEG